MGILEACPRLDDLPPRRYPASGILARNPRMPQIKHPIPRVPSVLTLPRHMLFRHLIFLTNAPDLLSKGQRMGD